MKTCLVVAGLLHRGQDVLLVCQQGPHDPAPAWALPGGVVEAGESLVAALVREVREETGLAVVDVRRLLYSVQVVGPDQDASDITFVFEIDAWEGQLVIADPDTLVLTAQFVSSTEAMAKLATLPWRPMREPIVAYLRGEAQPGAVWLYDRLPAGTETLLAFVG